MGVKALPYHYVNALYVPCYPDEATHITIAMPGPLTRRMLRVGGSLHPRWEWNKDCVRVTLTPSILTTGVRPLTTEEAERVLRGENVDVEEIRCHSFVTDGHVRFLPDCSHSLAGMEMDLLDVEEV